MRTPNSECLICGKPLYRRPNELRRVRHVACMAHRAEAQKRSGITPAQRRGLALGREKGTNHRAGYKHKMSSRRKASRSHKAWCAANPDKVKARGLKIRGPKNWKWKGGSSRLNTSIRRMTEHRRWSNAVRERDECCVDCGSCARLEAHHVVELAILVAVHGIKNRDDAARCVELWDIANGLTLCVKCHCSVHGREYVAAGSGRRRRK